MEHITVPAQIDRLEDVLAFVGERMQRAGVNGKLQNKINIVVEEIFVNVANYAYSPGEGDFTAGILINREKLYLEFKDGGVPYNPFLGKDPDISLPIDERKIGGLGKYLVKKIMDETHYEYKDGKNVVTVCKNL